VRRPRRTGICAGIGSLRTRRIHKLLISLYSSGINSLNALDAPATNLVDQGGGGETVFAGGALQALDEVLLDEPGGSATRYKTTARAITITVPTTFAIKAGLVR
jgi:hypothetical protein